MFICPICKGALMKRERTLCCPKNHSFDLAAQGYVNLLPANRKSSANPGDNAEMVASRTRFLDSGFYAPLSNTFNAEIAARAGAAPRILDAGCGEGYYAARMYDALHTVGKDAALYGVDISKAAVRHAARRCRAAHFAVASLFALPFSDGAFDVCCNIFSPLCAPELLRVLAPGSVFAAVYPAARHLYGLKEILYEHPYENPDKTFELEGFCIESRRRISYEFTLDGNDLIESLFMMTPYYYRTPAQGAQRLSLCDCLRTEADFWIVFYRREGAAWSM